MKKIQPTILKEMCNFLPQRMMRWNAVMEIIRKTFEQFGYSPYDLTVPLARFIATNYQKLSFPFKCYQIQRVWRTEKQQKGSLREFYQCNVDIIGSKSLICEAEMAKIIVSVFEKLGLPNIIIKVNSRSLMNVILKSFGVNQNESPTVIRLINKITKIGKKEVISKLKTMGIKNAESIVSTLIPEKTNRKTLEKISKYRPDELKEFLSYCNDLGIPEKNLQIDPTVTRGINYYTGLIFEVVTKEDDFGFICAGGRYDNLCSLFSNKNFSGVGISFKFEQIMFLLEQLKIVNVRSFPSQVLVTIFDKNTIKEALQIYRKLIEANIATEIYFEPDKLSKQFRFADKKGIPFVVIQGPKERERQEITIKQLKNGKQKTIPINQIVSYFSNYYEAENN